MLSAALPLCPCLAMQGHVEMLRAVFRLKPLDVAPLPANRLRRWCHHLAYNRWFDRFMLLTILLNIVLTATTYYHEPARFARGGLG